MLTISRALSAGQAENYYRRELASDYYTSGESPTEWTGEQARLLGLEGPVTKEDFGSVLAGLDPRTGEVLVGGSTAHEGKRRAAWDCEFSPPKSVSLVALIGGDERLVTAHDRAVSVALRELERAVRCRPTQRDEEGHRTGNLCIAKFRHIASRELDPHLHTHSVVANLTWAGDRWRAIEARELFKLQRYGTAVYRAELARQARELGYGVEIGKKGAWEIAGITREQIDEFSRRHAQIVAEAAAKGLSIEAAGEEIKYATRRTKRDVDRQTLVAGWAEQARAIGLDVAKLVAASRAAERTESQFERVEHVLDASRDAVTHAIAHVSERESAAPLTAYTTEALIHGMGRTMLADVRSEFDSRRRRREFLELERDHEIHTTPEILRLERQIVRLLGQGWGIVDAIGAPRDGRSRWPDLSDEQRSLVEFILETSDRIVGVQADAGTGKSETAAALYQYLKARVGPGGEPWHLVALGPFSGAVESLQERGLPARTVASFLGGEPSRLANQIWLVDESGTISTTQMHQLLQRAADVGARVILYGDTRRTGDSRPGQHNAVLAGDPFRLLQERGLAVTTLTKKWRQKDNPDLELVADAASRGRRAAARRLGGRESGRRDARQRRRARQSRRRGQGVSPKTVRAKGARSGLWQR